SDVRGARPLSGDAAERGAPSYRGSGDVYTLAIAERVRDPIVDEQPRCHVGGSVCYAPWRAMPPAAQSVASGVRHSHDGDALTRRRPTTSDGDHSVLARCERTVIPSEVAKRRR